MGVGLWNGAQMQPCYDVWELALMMCWIGVQMQGLGESASRWFKIVIDGNKCVLVWAKEPDDLVERTHSAHGFA